MDVNELMDEVSRRAEAGDAEGMAALCSPDLRFTQNTGADGGVEGLIALIEGLNALGVTVAYSNVRRLIADRGVTEQHLVTLTRADGVSASTDICVVARIGEDGLIAEIDEYLDGAAFAAILS